MSIRLSDVPIHNMEMEIDQIMSSLYVYTCYPHTYKLCDNISPIADQLLYLICKSIGSLWPASRIENIINFHMDYILPVVQCISMCQIKATNTIRPYTYSLKCSKYKSRTKLNFFFLPAVALSFPLNSSLFSFIVYFPT